MESREVFLFHAEDDDGVTVVPDPDAYDAYSDLLTWQVFLPHQCDEWDIALGADLEDVIGQAEAFRDAVTAAIEYLKRQQSSR
jgi:hypothetical protein